MASGLLRPKKSISHLFCKLSLPANWLKYKYCFPLFWYIQKRIWERHKNEVKSINFLDKWPSPLENAILVQPSVAIKIMKVYTKNTCLQVSYTTEFIAATTTIGRKANEKKRKSWIISNVNCVLRTKDFRIIIVPKPNKMR